MQELLREYLGESRSKRKKRRRISVAVTLLVVMVAGGVIGALVQYGIAMTGDAKCGLEEHTHSEECYEDVLVCGQEESEGHTHTDACYQTESTLTCGLEESEPTEESEGHTHTDACYTETQTLVCGQEESEGHTHTDACYERQIVCGKEEHIHTDACYIDTAADVEDASIWNKQYEDVEWQGAWGEDLVTAAKAQVGYKESTKNYSIADDQSHKGYTRYGQFTVNEGYNEADVYADWDASFVDFCLFYTGLAGSNMFPAETQTVQWYEEFMKIDNGANAGYLTAPEGYEPKVGDIVFFQRENEETQMQMGIVSAFDEDKNEIRVIEGNVDNEVREEEYTLEESHIHSYVHVTELEKAYKGAGETEVPAAEAKEETTGEEATEEETTIEEEAEEEEQETKEFTQSAETENYVVTVQYGSDAELPEDAKLQVVEYAEDSEEFQERAEELGRDPEWYLNIGFFVDDEEVEPQAQVNVTVTSKEAAEAADYDIIHFGNAGTEELNGVGRKDEEGNVVTEFTAGSFSDYVALAGDDGIVAAAAVPTLGDSLTHVDPSGDHEGRNDWQIVKEGYQGNSSENKAPAPADNMVRVQKNVVPTDVENEFLVYLSIDVNSWLQNLFDKATYEATTSKNYKVDTIGTLKPTMTGNKNVKVSKVPVKDYWYNTFRIVTEKGGPALSEVTLYFSQANNITMYLQVGNQYLIIGAEMKEQEAGGTREVLLADGVLEQIEKMVEQYSATLNSVTDEMGDYIKFLGVESCTEGTSVTPAEDGRSLNWNVSSVSTTGNGWRTNVAELVYRVKLDVTKEGFESCAETLNDKDGSPQYEVNKSATLNYTVTTTKNGQKTKMETKDEPFPKPYVRGLLYDLQFTKKGTNGSDDCLGWLLPEATFKLTQTQGNVTPSIEKSETSGSDGVVRFEDLPWGTYKLEETEAPDGYKKADSIEDIILCYTTNPNLLEQDSKKEANEIYKEPINSEKNENVIWDVAKEKIAFEKRWDDNNDALEERPREIEIKLKAEVGGVDVTNTYMPNQNWITVTVDDDWKYEWENEVPTRTNNNLPIIWSVEEKPVSSYTIGDSGSSTVNDIKTYFIENKLQEEWQIVKKSSSDDTLLLEGAEFTLTRQVSLSTGENEPTVVTGESKTGGIIEWPDSIKTLNGSYTLRETKAPSGYSCSNTEWVIEFVNGFPKTVTEGGNPVGNKEITDSNGTKIYTYTFTNTPLFALPSTGGAGIYLYMFGGILLMAGASLITYKKRCREVLRS